MCVLALAWKAHPRWHLVAVANRDELHSRPSAHLHRWADEPDVLAGRDEVSAGTWLGIVPATGRFCAVTNVSGTEHSVDAPSRGNLVENFLSSTEIPSPLRAGLGDFNGFNLAMIAGGEASLWTNVPAPTRRRLDHGIHGLSNGALSSRWPKVAMLEAGLAEWMACEASTAELLDLLSSTDAFEPLPHQPGSATPLFVNNGVYGTRCSTVVAVSSSGAGSIIERRFDPGGKATGDTRLSFEWTLANQ